MRHADDFFNMNCALFGIILALQSYSVRCLFSEYFQNTSIYKYFQGDPEETTPLCGKGYSDKCHRFCTLRNRIPNCHQGICECECRPSDCRKKTTVNLNAKRIVCKDGTLDACYTFCKGNKMVTACEDGKCQCDCPTVKCHSHVSVPQRPDCSLGNFDECYNYCASRSFFGGCDEDGKCLCYMAVNIT